MVRLSCRDLFLGAQSKSLRLDALSFGGIIRFKDGRSAQHIEQADIETAPP
jgi:hypothetical protein